LILWLTKKSSRIMLTYLLTLTSSENRIMIQMKKSKKAIIGANFKEIFKMTQMKIFKL
jgi:hypothetical protein